MKTLHTFLLLTLVITGGLVGCSSGDDTDQMLDDDVIQNEDPNTPDDPEEPNATFEEVAVQVSLPQGASLDVSTAKLFSLGSTSAVASSGQGTIPFNPGTVELAYLLDAEDNLLLAGFVSEDQKELSVATTVEVMLYFGLDYYLLPNSAKAAFLKGVRQTSIFNGLKDEVEQLFINDPLMFTKGSYTSALTAALDQLSTNKGSNHMANRIFFNDETTKSGVTLSAIDSTRIQLQNALPRRSRVLIYKKSITDRDGNEMEIPNYTDTPFENFELEIGKLNEIENLNFGSSLAQISAQQASIDNASSTGPILLPVNPVTEFVAEYEVVLIGSGQPQDEARNMTMAELEIYGNLTKRTYILDYFLPTLLEIGGNRSLLPPFGSAKQEALFNAISPILEQYPDVLDEVADNEFKSASNILLPALYEDIRLSNDLRTILTDVYNILSGNGDFPNTFIQSQELIETGYPRTRFILRTIDRNIKASNPFANFAGLDTAAFNFESWLVQSIDAVVDMQQDNVELCLGEATELRVTAITSFEPEVEEFEFHWSTSNEFGGRVQDIGGDPNNFVSYISTALESNLGSGNNPETVTVVLYFRNKNTGELSEAGRDTMTVNNIKGCESFFVGFTQEVEIAENPEDLGCGGNTEYRVQGGRFVARFAPVENAVSYTGRILRKDGTFGNEFSFVPNDIGNGLVEFFTAIEVTNILFTCNRQQAEERQQELFNRLEEIGHQGIEITPVF